MKRLNLIKKWPVFHEAQYVLVSLGWGSLLRSYALKKSLKFVYIRDRDCMLRELILEQ